MTNSEISAACSECGTDVAITVPYGEDLMLTHVAFVREQAAHAVLQHGHQWGAATHTAVRHYSRAYVVTALQQWRQQHERDVDVVPPITT
jgi:hypothetical protein